MTILFDYVLFNALFFGGIVALAKTIEYWVWYVICNYNEIMK